MTQIIHKHESSFHIRKKEHNDNYDLWLEYAGNVVFILYDFPTYQKANEKEKEIIRAMEDYLL